MWSFKSSKTQNKKPLPKMVFKSPEAFFENQCQWGVTDIRQNQGIVAIVEAGPDASVPEPRTFEDRQTVGLRVASSDGGFEVMAQPLANGPLLRKGDCVIWVPLQYEEAFTVLTGDPRSGWVGFIVAKIAPEIDPMKATFDVLHRYDQP